MHEDIVTNIEFQVLSAFVILCLLLVLGLCNGFVCLLDKSVYVLYESSGCGVIVGLGMGAKCEVYR